MKKLIIFALVPALSVSAFAHTWWDGAVSNRWDDASNWTGGLPVADGSSAAALVDVSATTATLLIDSATAAAANRFYLSDTADDPRLYTLNMTGGTLTCTTGNAEIAVGNWYNTTAEFNLSGGDVTTSDLILGWYNGAAGVMTMDGGTVSYDHQFTLASFPGTTGELNLNDGTITYTGAAGTALGMVVGGEGAGTINMTGGDITTSDLILGYNNGATGVMTMTGGTVSYDHRFTLAYLPDTTGELNMNGGTITYTGGAGNALGMLVGDEGAGTINMTGGEIDLGDGALYVPWDGTAAQVHLDGGVIRTANLSMDGRGSLDITGGTLILDGKWDETHEYVTSGWITGYGNPRTLIFNYDGSKTTITAIKLYGDMNNDDVVDIVDMSLFAALWLEDDCGITAKIDLGGDCLINYQEFAKMAGNWLRDCRGQIGVIITEEGGSTDVDEDGPTFDTYTLVLNAEPTANVTITVDPDVDTEVNGNGAGNSVDLTFTTSNWGTAQTVTIRAIDDADEEGPHTSMITHSVSGNGYDCIWVDNVVVNVTDNDIDAYSHPVLLKKITLGDYGSKYTRIGDLDGDGILDLLFAQTTALQEITCLTAIDRNGTFLWQRGTPDINNIYFTSDYPLQIHDWDNDGDNEVLYMPDDNNVLTILNGETGALISETPLAGGHDSILFADFSGNGYAQDLLIKDRYTSFWIYDKNLNLLWSKQNVNTGHYPMEYNFDDDGKDELLCGYVLYDDDGGVIWDKNLSIPGHNDAVYIDDMDGDGQAEIALATQSNAFLLDADGNTLFQEPMVHSQHALIGKFRPDLTGKQVWYIDRMNATYSDVSLYKIDGTELVSDKTNIWVTGGLVIDHWVEDPNKDFLGLYSRGFEPPGILNGIGLEIATFPLPEAIIQAGGAPGGRDLYDDYYMQHVDCWGDAREEIICYNHKVVYIWTNGAPSNLPDANAGWKPTLMKQPARLYNTNFYPGRL